MIIISDGHWEWNTVTIRKGGVMIPVRWLIYGDDDDDDLTFVWIIRNWVNIENDVNEKEKVRMRRRLRKRKQDIDHMIMWVYSLKNDNDDDRKINENSNCHRFPVNWLSKGRWYRWRWRREVNKLEI